MEPQEADADWDTFMEQSGKKPNSVLRSVIRDWEQCGKPRWNLDETVRRTIAADQRLEARRLNPAPKFRSHRLAARHDDVERWVRGCKFSWLA